MRHTIRTSCLLLIVVGMLLSILPTAAQAPELIATDLLSPRGIAYDDAGNLWIAESGSGGDIMIAEEGPFGPVTAGNTSRATMIAPDGSKTEVLSGFASLNAGGALGIVRIKPVGDLLYVLTSEGTPNNPFAGVLLILDAATLRVQHIIDVFAYENANNPDGTEEVYSNTSDVDIALDGTVYITDTGGNTLYTWTEADGLQVFLTWNTNPVPMAAAFGADGTVWVAFLGQAIASGAAVVEQWSADGSQLLATYTGMTSLTDIYVAADGGVYAVRMAEFAEGEVPIPDTGAVLKLEGDAFVPVVEGLSFPYGIAQAPDGAFAVSFNTLIMAPEMVGGVLRIDG